MTRVSGMSAAVTKVSIKEARGSAIVKDGVSITGLGSRRKAALEGRRRGVAEGPRGQELLLPSSSSSAAGCSQGLCSGPGVKVSLGPDTNPVCFRGLQPLGHLFPLRHEQRKQLDGASAPRRGELQTPRCRKRGVLSGNGAKGLEGLEMRPQSQGHPDGPARLVQALGWG